jgi:3'(2'), 5'-bisphosphate nucleotidase
MSRDLNLALLAARSAARHAAAKIATLYTAYRDGDSVSVESKGEDGPVTAADRAANEIILTELHSAFPDDAILSEECPESFITTGEWTWMVDPLDGTEEFLKKNGEFMVMIGLCHRGVPVVGVVIEPATFDECWAIRGQGAFRLAPGDTQPSRLRVSELRDPAQMTVAVSRSHRSPRVKAFCEQLQMTKECVSGSVGRKIALLTTGRADVYLHPSPGTKLWDTCAPQLIHEEAGGVFTTALGDPIRYVRKDGDVRNDEGILAAGPAVFEVLLAASRRAWEIPLPARSPAAHATSGATGGAKR